MNNKRFNNYHLVVGDHSWHWWRFRGKNYEFIIYLRPFFNHTTVDVLA